LADLADTVFRTYKPRGIRDRARHEIRRRLGLYERLVPRKAPPGHPVWPSIPSSRLRGFYERHPGVRDRAISDGQAVLDGRLSFFGGHELSVGFPPRWDCHPTTGHTWERSHWTQVDTSDPVAGDVKWLWELGRFGWAQTLARAYVASSDPRFASGISTGMRSFLGDCPPYEGAHWHCGQETALRAFAVTLSMSVLGDALTPADEEVATQFLYDSVRRVDASLEYALSQRNNHALSELAGLWLIAHVCPHFPGAPRYKRRVRSLLPTLLSDQFAKDGSYIQESFYYHRTALAALLLLRWTERMYGESLSPLLDSALRRSATYLDPFVSKGGRVPNLGANDGGRVTQLSDCGYEDFRPLLQHIQARLEGTRRYPEGAWDEECVWFDAPFSDTEPPLTGDLRAQVVTTSGNLASRREYSRLFFRVPNHSHHRPSHADALHVDLWLQEENVAADPGTYLYTGAPPWQNSLSETRVHNTCSVGDESQMQRQGRFFWTAWNRSTLERHQALGEADLFWAHTSADPMKAFRHDRLVLHMAGGALILDKLFGNRDDTLRVHWNLPADLRLAQPGELENSRLRVFYAGDPVAQTLTNVGDLESSLGWVSPTYGKKEPCLALELSAHARCAHFFTFLSWRQSQEHTARCLELWDTWRSQGPARTSAFAARLFG